jgi:serine/threonine protein kinase
MICGVLDACTFLAAWHGPADVNLSGRCASIQMTAMYQICKDRQAPMMPENLSPEGRDFLELCWQWDPRNRPNCDRLLMHPFIKSAPTPKAVNAVHQMHPAVGTMPSPVQEERQSQDSRGPQHDKPAATPRALCSRQ